MPSRAASRAILAAVVLLAIAAAPARADKCTGAKLKAVGKEESGLLGCQSKVAAKGDSSGLGACETKVSGKFSIAFGKAGACAGDETTCENIADSCESSVAGDFIDTFPSKCEAAKRKAAGKLTSGELGCYAKAAAKGLAVDSACITKATGKFSTAMTKAGTCPDGGSPQMLVEDKCIAPAVATDGGGMVTDVCPTTTTSTTTTSTTSSTVPLAIVSLSGCAVSGYTAPIVIGTQSFDLIADSGSTTLAVASTACPTCTGVSPLYGPGATAMDQGTTATATFGDGSGWMAEVFSDLVSATGHVTSVRMAFGAITSNLQGFFDTQATCNLGVNVPYQGIMGLAGPALLVSGTDSYLDKLALLGTFADVFSVRLCASGGTLWLGGYDPSAAAAPPSFTPMVGGSSLDRVTLAAVGVGGNAVTVDVNAIVDTGTTATVLPTAALDVITSTVGANPTFTQNFSGGASWFTSGSCAIPAQGLTKAQLDSALPMLELTFPSSPSTTFTVDLPATDSYLLAETDSGGHTYYCPGVANSGGPLAIIGGNAMHSLLTVFDRQNQQIGFAPGQGCPIMGNVARQSRATPPPQTVPAPPYRRHVEIPR
jgi:hypothetical protein